MIDPAERWKRIEALCQAALQLAASERGVFLQTNADDEGLRRDVERLLEQESRAEGFLEFSDAAASRLALERAPLSQARLPMDASSVHCSASVRQRRFAMT